MAKSRKSSIAEKHVVNPSVRYAFTAEGASSFWVISGGP